eukprot:COSAG01_NODE_19417_length_1010_cov_2.001098_2_plen_218_part_01
MGMVALLAAVLLLAGGPLCATGTAGGGGSKCPNGAGPGPEGLVWSNPGQCTGQQREVCPAQCDQGYVSDGKRSQSSWKCTWQGSNNGDPPAQGPLWKWVDQAKPNQQFHCQHLCPQMSPVAHANACVEGSPGDTCTVYCQDGYTGTGGNVYRCDQAGKHWVPMAADPSDRLTCDRPPPPPPPPPGHCAAVPPTENAKQCPYGTAAEWKQYSRHNCYPG